MKFAFRTSYIIHPLVVCGLCLHAFMLSSCTASTKVKESSLTPTEKPSPTIKYANLPDLVVSEVSIELKSQDVCAAETDLSLTRVVIHNAGSHRAGPFIVEMNAAWQEVSSGLSAGEDIILWFHSSETAAVTADVTNQIAEMNENNNQIQTSLEIPSLAPTCFYTPTAAATIIEPTHTLEGHTAAVLSVDISPDGHLAGSGSVDNTLRLWRVNEAELLRTMYGHPFPVTTLEFSPDGTLLITGSTDGLVRIWNVSDGRLLRVLKGHAGEVNRINISKDGKNLVSCADDFTVRVWRIFDGSLLQMIDEGMAMISDVEFSPDGQSLAWAEANGYVRVRSLDGTWLYIFKDSESPATSVAFSQDGNLLAAGYADGIIHVYDLLYGELHQIHSGHKDRIESLTFSPKNDWMASASADYTIRLWRINKYGYPTYPVFILVGHTGTTNNVTFSSNDSLIASGSDDNTVRIWQIPTQ